MESYFCIIMFLPGLLIGLGLGMKSLKEEAEYKYIEEIKKLTYRIKYLESHQKTKKPVIPIIYP